MSLEIDRQVPARINQLTFRLKSSCLQLQRGWRNWHDPAISKFPHQSQLNDANICAESQTDLWIGASEAEWILQAGKIHNLRLAISKINSV
jgi:hypothetical protein